MPPKILIYDTENFPNLGLSWGKWEQNILHFVRERMMCSVAYKWLGEKKVTCLALPDYPGYQKDRFNNRAMLKDFYKVINEADITVAHNACKFDEKMTNAEFLKAGMGPVSPHKVVDTLRIAKRHFALNSNKLDDLGQLLGVGRKVKHEGLGLWLKCMEGDARAWKKMIRYNIQDVDLLERVYKRLAPWSPNHPNMNNFIEANGKLACPHCKSEKNITKDGVAYLSGGKKKQCYSCKCGKYSREAGKKGKEYLA